MASPSFGIDNDCPYRDETTIKQREVIQKNRGQVRVSRPILNSQYLPHAYGSTQ